MPANCSRVRFLRFRIVKKMSTAAILSHSHNVLRAKQRARREQIKEISFDDDARHDFLTGFHKRKLARTEEKKKKAQARDKQLRLDDRKESRKALADQARKNAAAVERALGADLPSESDDDREEQSSKHQRAPREDEMEYEDEEQLATVTVVEDFSTDDLILGPQRLRQASGEPDDSVDKADTPRQQAAAIRTKAKTREPKFRYETKAARKAAKDKQKIRHASKVVAGGGGSRHSSGKSSAGTGVRGRKRR
ncbi:nucleolar protein 12-domain-containing protein [Auriculariales sp. MPI-PUGE-AT-0066]|nr:nucleolar protein 12-domain-containing protein [Auriculariales sp. MPI-PUGE-AT-0066]